MSDFAPRDKFDIHEVIRETNLELASLLGLPVPRTFSVLPTETSSPPAGASCQPARAAAGHEGDGGR